MSPATSPEPDPVAELAKGQGGALARRQLRQLGVARTAVRSHVRGRRWQRPLPGVYVTFTGPLPTMTRVWVALLYAGEGAVASHETAAWLTGLTTEAPRVVDVTVPHGHRHRGSRGDIRLRQSRNLADKRHPARLPPQTRLDDTVLDLTDDATTEDPVIDAVLRACQRRLTTAARLAARARARKRLRWRRLVIDLVSDVRDGVQSPLERAFARNVERAHRLPRGLRNRGEGPRGRRRYRDVRYRRWRTIVELDGRAAHPDEWQEADDLRDNEVVDAEAVRTLRYGWRSATVLACETAAQLGRVLRSGGWIGSPVQCGPDCRMTTPVSAGSDG